MTRFLAVIVMVTMVSAAQAQLLKKLKTKVKAVTTTTTTAAKASTSTSSLTNADYVNGLKEALSVAASNSSVTASAVDGFYKNAEIKIPFPSDAIAVRDYALKIGLKPQVDVFEEKLNRAAELAAKKAAPIFLSAIKNMSITDAMNIAMGDKNAATQYLRKTSGAELATQFKPIVAEALSSVAITKYWKPLADSYNKVSLFIGKEQVNADLEQYVTQKAVDGLFVLVEKEEGKIRKEPLKYGSDLLSKIFNTTK